MEEGSIEQTTVVMRLIAAARAQEDDPGWSITVLTAGIQITYTWQHVAFHPFTGRPRRGNCYTVERLTLWIDIAHEPVNPLLTVMDALMTQKTEFKP